MTPEQIAREEAVDSWIDNIAPDIEEPTQEQQLWLLWGNNT